MTDPSFVAIATTAATTSALTQSITVPGSVQAGDVCLLVPESDAGTVPNWAPSGSGWSTLVAGFAATNTCAAIFWRRRQAGDSSTITVAASNAGYSNLTAIWYRDAADPTLAGSPGIRSGTSFTATAPAITVVGRTVVLTLAGDRSIAATAGEQGNPTFSAGGTVRGAAPGVATLNASTGIASLTVADRIVAAAGSSGIDTATWPDSSGNAWAIQVGLTALVPATFAVYDGAGVASSLYYTTSTAGGAGSVAVPTDVLPMRKGFASITDLLAKPGFTIAHRGGSIDWPEMSLYAYTRSVARGYGAMELSIAKTSDGVWFGLHDDTIDRTSGITGQPVASTMTWAQIQAYNITIGLAGAPQPYMKLSDYIAAYGKTHVTFYDAKYLTTGERAALWAYLADAVGPQKAVAKNYGIAPGLAAQAASYGLKSWGYFYQTEYANGTMATNTDGWDILGMDYTATAAAWSAILSYGKPVIGHIAPNQTAYATARTFGAVGVMCSSPATITPVSWWT